jgi:hypothetical protein
MGYVIAAIIVLLLVAGFITFMVVNATRRGDRSPTGIVAPDESPLGDTVEHSGMDPAAEREDEPEPRDTRPESERLANAERPR